MGALRPLKNEQLSSPNNQRKAKGKMCICNAIYEFLTEGHIGTRSVTDLKVEMTVMATHLDEASPSGTCFGKKYFRDYSKIGQRKPAETLEEPTKKQKELHFQKVRKKIVRQLACLSNLTC